MSTLPDPSSNLSIAIVGGGLAGLATAIGLLKNSPHLSVTIYEAAHSFMHVGGGLAFGANSLRAMTYIDPGLRERFNQICTTNQWESKKDTWFEFRWGMDMEHKTGTGKAGELIVAVRCPEGQATVHRAGFLEEVIKLIPKDVTQFGKRLAQIQELEGGLKLELQFKDGTTAVHDAVIGADGIKSQVRRLVAPECAPAFSTKYVHRGVISMEKAIEVLGEERATTNTGHLGKHGHTIMYPVDKGQAVSVTLFSGGHTWDSPSWVVPTTRPHMHSDFAGWAPEIHAIIDAMEDTSIWAVFDLYDHPASTYVRGNACITGDAAHASTSYQGSGAGMAMEDGYVLSGILHEIKTAEDVPKAMQAYNAVRYPRTQKFCKTSREAGNIWEFEAEEIGLDVEKTKANILGRMAWIWDEDLQGEVREGVRIMKDM